jgi:hypothetical protein
MEIRIVVAAAVTTNAPGSAMSWACGGFSLVAATNEALTPPWTGFSVLNEVGVPGCPEAGVR